MTAATPRTSCKVRRIRKPSGGWFSRRTLTPAQEAVAVVLRKTLLVPLDDLLAVVKEFLNPEVSRSGLDRCLRRHGVGNLAICWRNRPGPSTSRSRPARPAICMSM